MPNDNAAFERLVLWNALEIVSPFNQLLIAHYGYLAVDPTQKQVMQNGQASENLDDIDSEFAEILDRTDHAAEDKRSVCRKFEAASHDRASQVAASTTPALSEAASFLFNESKTWSLISALFTNVQHIENVALQEHSAVLRWLQETAPELGPISYSKGEWRYAGVGSIEERSRKVGANMKTTTMMEVDDDGPFRQRRRLENQNTDFSRNMTRSLFNYIRRGQIKEAIKMCELCDEPWQSAGLYGYLEHKEGLTDENGGLQLRELTPAESTARQLWRTSCSQIAKDTSADLYERATYAALCGDVENTLAACSTWEDVVWACYNALVENMLHDLLTLNHGSTSGIPPEEIIFSSAQRKDFGADIPTRCFHYIQAMIITNRIDDLINTLHGTLVLKQTSNELKLPVDSDLRLHLLRFATLAILYLISISAYTSTVQSDAIICEYIKHHSQSDGGLKAQLVALYCSKLSNVDQQVEMYSMYLDDFDGDRNERELLIEVAQHHHLDVYRILLILYKRAAPPREQKHSPASSPKTIRSEPISPDTIRQIRGLEWLTLDPRLHSEAIIRSNDMIRYYLAQGNISAAQAVFAQLPSSLISSILTNQIHHIHDLTQIVAEMKLHDALIESWSLFNAWSSLHSKRPTTDDTLDSLRAYQGWVSQFEQLSVSLISKLQHLLRSRWCFSDNPEQIIPNSELRQMYIPELVLNLHQVLFETHDLLPGNLQKSLEISDMVASDEFGIHVEFVRAHRMGELVQRLQKTYIKML
ncbi:Nucleoporin nup84 [Umbelopsis nana]